MATRATKAEDMSMNERNMDSTHDVFGTGTQFSNDL
jgi:hypothetical protein